jgi:hypothetical protein
MKKITMIALAMATIAIAGASAQADWWFITTTEGGPRPRNNPNVATLRQGQTNYVYVSFRGDMNPVGAEFDRMRINFTISRPLEVIWQCVYYADMAGGVLGAEISTGVRDAGPLETDFSNFILPWAGRDRVLGKPKMNGFCLAIPIPRGEGNATFTMTSIEFIGLQK